MEHNLDTYKHLLGDEPIEDLHQLAAHLRGKKIVHINSTKEGGGVAEILMKMIPITEALGLDVRWEVIEAEADFYKCSKMFHNLLQGQGSSLPEPELLALYESTNKKNAQALQALLQEADIVFIHDPQPLALISHFPHRKGKWIWRCHIDISNPLSALWSYLKPFVEMYDTSIVSIQDYVQPLSHPVYVIAPSIDPLSEKNMELSHEEVLLLLKEQKIDTSRPYVLQVSRFDRFKDPVGVIEAYRLVKNTFAHLQLVLAGSGASDDPEGEEVLREVLDHVKGDVDIHVLLLPPTSHRIVNALQRGADVVIQKSLKEGFGLTVSEALWKRKPVVGGDTGGIRLQVVDQHSGFLVSSIEEAAEKIKYLLVNQEIAKAFGEQGKQHVKEHFLITRHLREYLSVMAAYLFPQLILKKTPLKIL